jgi:hypothetical protein
MAAIHYRTTADLDHVEIGQDGSDRRFRRGDEPFIDQRLAHKA